MPDLTPFTPRRDESVAALGERRLLCEIVRWLKPSPPPPAGIGDDTAVLPLPKSPHLLLTTDSLVHGIHFDNRASPAQAGAKLVLRNLSDIAAMGGTPTQALLALFLGPDTRVSWLRDFYKGLHKALRQYGTTLCGGDLTSAPAGFLAANMTLLGHAPHPIARNTARAGDLLCVTGTLGGSILGRHLRPIPRLAEGQWLARRPAVTAMMDLSDGLAKDLPCLLPPGTQAQIDPAAMPLSREARRLARCTRSSPLQHALNDGEDYELLFALRPTKPFRAFLPLWQRHFDTPLTCIGRIATAPPEAPLLAHHHSGQALTEASGFEHFT